MSEKPLYKISREGQHIFLTVIGGEDSTTVELDAAEALDLAEDLRSFAFDIEFEDDEA
jgi:hypothetical protein